MSSPAQPAPSDVELARAALAAHGIAASDAELTVLAALRAATLQQTAALYIPEADLFGPDSDTFPAPAPAAGSDR